MMLFGVFHRLGTALSEWTLSGASIALDNLVQVLPDITQRHGFVLYVLFMKFVKSFLGTKASFLPTTL